MHVSEKFLSFLPESISCKSTDFFVSFFEPAIKRGKKLYYIGNKVQIVHYDKKFGSNFHEVSEEEAKQKHLGRIRCLGEVQDEYELLVVMSKYFLFETPEPYEVIRKAIKEQKQKKEKQIKVKKKTLELRTNELPCDRDEKKLIIEYRSSTSDVVKNKIFKTILFQRGVNGKTWEKIIRNYVSYNKSKFSQYREKSEDDFYQDIVIALETQVAKWFDVEKECCFSTYAWFVINCAFKRQLQMLSTQKRKASSVKNNIELDDHEASWDQIISIEKTQNPKHGLEEEIHLRDICSRIFGMFELKEINAPEELKVELLSVIKNKSTMQNSLYALAKKYDFDIDKLFELERLLRDNVRNAMYKDILFNMKYDINADDFIAKKYKRSKGHVIKMKKQLSKIVISKLEGVVDK